ncbi:ADP-ribosylation factor-like protein 16 isoform X2 [Branchiostoma lanceolatum]|uniref:ADP-ribosylation factor-like protein 16 isoform X2 n=1 Tax=Branchiostoma lanceolatum TaxID=7740 RepID=UPI003451381E
MCLLVGPPGVGKTLLLKRLQFLSGKDKLGDMEEAPATIPTVGTNLVNVQVGKKTELTVRELGGSMGPIWHSYYKDCKLLLFMVDASNAAQLSASTIQLLTTLTDDRLEDVSVLILLNKVYGPAIIHGSHRAEKFDETGGHCLSCQTEGHSSRNKCQRGTRSGRDYSLAQGQ